MNSDLMMALLALDSYNRGYQRGISEAAFSDDDHVGAATIIARSETGPSSSEVEAGFFAVAYRWNNQTIISFRGTNFNDGLLQDAFYGWLMGGGAVIQPQILHAVRFYRQVLDQVQAQGLGGEIILTGHSLGGGLAGLVGSIYHQSSVNFNNEPFELAARNAYSAAAGSTPPLLWPTIKEDIYGSGPVYEPSFAGARTIYTQGEILTALRHLQDSPMTKVVAHSELGAVALHSQAILVALKWAEVHGRTGWEPAGKFLWKQFGSEEVASHIAPRGAPEGTIGLEKMAGPDGKGPDVLQRGLAYSALTEGERPFGDTGIAAFFNDGIDLGRALGLGNSSTMLAMSADLLALTLVHFAGKLAVGDVEGGINADVTNGVLHLSQDGKTLAVDFSSALWSRGAKHDLIAGRAELLNQALATLSIAAQAADVATGMKWLWNDADPSIVDRVIFQTTNEPVESTLPARGSIGGKVSAFVAGDGDDKITGSAEDEIIHGGNGADTLKGGGGDDLLLGGVGNDTLWGGPGRDFLAGGSGQDRIDLRLDLRPNVGAEINLRAINATPAKTANGTTPAEPATRASFELTDGDDVDRAVDVEKVQLTDNADNVTVAYLGDPYGAEAPMGSLTVDFLGSPLELNVDLLDFSGAGVANAWGTTPAGIKVDLRNAADQTVQYYYVLAELPTGHQLTWTQSDVQLRAANANSVKGTQYADWLIGNGGRWEDGEGFSTLYGQGGNDTLQGAGRETHMFGGEGSDTFKIGANSWVEDAESHDRVTYAGFTIFGGAKQWWMEGGTAAWMPFSTVMSGFPVIGSQILTAAAFFVDVMTMKFASFQRDASGDLVMVLGWGHGGFGIIKDYHLDLDSGVASGGVTVFQSEWAEDFSFSNLRQFLNLALKAGFGVGFGGFDPLVLDLDGDGFELTSEGNSKVYFEFDGDGFGERTGWVRGDDGLLARDANGNGRIDDVTELFGNRTQSGFAALGAFDLNADGIIDAQDVVYSELRVWRDADQDGVTDETLANLLTSGAATPGDDVAPDVGARPSGDDPVDGRDWRPRDCDDHRRQRTSMRRRRRVQRLRQHRRRAERDRQGAQVEGQRPKGVGASGRAGTLRRQDRVH